MSRERPIYLDYMATTPIDPAVIQVMLQYMGPDGAFGNSASKTHVYGQSAADAIETARGQVAQVIGAMGEEIIFTTGATNSNHLAILGSARLYQRKGKHVVTMNTEHKSVLDAFKQLEREGFEVTYLSPNKNGLLSLEKLEQVIRDDTILVSIMHVNNEIGVIQDIQAIGLMLAGKGIVFHVDAAQSAAKLPIDVNAMRVSLMSLSAHKVYGPKGVGALYIRQKPRIRLQPISVGATQERSLQAGTLATHQIVGMGAAFELAESLRVSEQTRILRMREQLWGGINDLSAIVLNGDPIKRIAGNLNFSVKGVDSVLLIPALYELAVSTTSACLSSQLQPSYVLEAIGVTKALALSSVRLSLGRFTTSEDIDKIIRVIRYRIKELTS